MQYTVFLYVPVNVYKRRVGWDDLGRIYCPSHSWAITTKIHLPPSVFRFPALLGLLRYRKSCENLDHDDDYERSLVIHENFMRSVICRAVRVYIIIIVFAIKLFISFFVW
jgi:hypothetical protein